MAKRRRAPWWELVPKDEIRRIFGIAGHPHAARISWNGTRCMRSSRHCFQVACKAKRLEAVGHLVPGFCGVAENTKIDPSHGWKEGDPLYHLSPRDSQKGKHLNPRDTERRDCKGSPIRVCGLTTGCPVLDASKGNWEDESWPIISSGWSWGESESGSHLD
jgi:hypothetical protein